MFTGPDWIPPTEEENAARVAYLKANKITVMTMWDAGLMIADAISQLSDDERKQLREDWMAQSAKQNEITRQMRWKRLNGLLGHEVTVRLTDRKVRGTIIGVYDSVEEHRVKVESGSLVVTVSHRDIYP
jgi:hypothetical protein